MAIGFCVASVLAAAGQGAPPPADVNATLVQALIKQMEELRAAFDNMRADLEASRRESVELRRELGAVRQQLEIVRGGTNVSAEPQIDDRISALTEDQELLKGKVDDQYQTKVESGSKYHVRLSGLALMNAFSTRGSVDDLDLPRIAVARKPGDSNGAFSASARQSRVNLEVFGPGWNGMKASGEMSFDFFGGYPLTADGV